MTELDTKTKEIIERNLSSDASEPLPLWPDAIERWRDHLPDILIKVWENYGFIKLAGGRLQLIDPRYLKPLISYITEDDPDLDSDTHAIAIGDFGEVIIWSERHGYGILLPHLRAFFMPYIMAPNLPPADQQIIEHVFSIDAERIEAYDPDQKPLHARLLKHLGPLPLLEIYGTTPVPPPLGGTSLDHYVIAEAADWLEATYTSGIAVGLMFDWGKTDSTGAIIQRYMREPWPDNLKTATRKASR